MFNSKKWWKGELVGPYGPLEVKGTMWPLEVYIYILSPLQSLRQCQITTSQVVFEKYGCQDMISLLQQT